MSDYAETLDAIYAAAAAPDASAWSGALARVADFTGAGGAMLIHNNLTGGQSFILVGRLREDLSELYLRDHVDNPYSRMTVGAAPGRPCVASRFVPLRLIRKTALHADILAPQAIEEQVVLPLDPLNRDGDSGGIGLTLDQRQAEDTIGVAKRLSRLAPHLSRAVNLSAWRLRASPRQDFASALLGALPGAAMLLDADGGLLHASHSAERLLFEGDGLLLRGHTAPRVAARCADADQKLQAALRKAAVHDPDGHEPPAQAIRVARLSGHAAYLVLVTPLPPTRWQESTLALPSARFLLQVVDPEARAEAGLSQLRSAFGLTPAEARVARLVASGLSTPQVATALRLRPNTVRTHLARCFDKTGARSQVALAQLFAVMAIRSSTS